MRGIPSLLLPALLIAAALLSPPRPLPAQGVSAEAVKVRGRLLDGTAMTRSLSQEAIHGHAQPTEASRTPIPLQNRSFRLHLIDGPRAGKSWNGTTDGEGRFELTLDVSELPSSRSLVAESPGAPPAFSAAVAWKPEEVEFRSFAVTSSDRVLEGELSITHALVENPSLERLDLEVKVQLFALNASGEMFIGRPPAGAPGGGASREVFRVPVPEDASILVNKGPRGERWTEVEGGSRWMAIRSPILPLLEDPRGAVWELVYRVKARQAMEFVYPLGFELSQFAAWGLESELEIEAPKFFGKQKPENASVRPDAREWTVHFAREGLQPGPMVPLAVHIDNARLGEVNRGSLFLMSLFLVAAVGSIAAGLIVGRRTVALDPGLGEATGEEVLARIVQLDARHERGEVAEAEYRAAREKLLSLARYAVPELWASGAEGAAGPGPPLPRAALDILGRLRRLEAGGPPDSQQIQERLILLEELRKALEASLERDPGVGRGRKGGAPPK